MTTDMIATDGQLLARYLEARGGKSLDSGAVAFYASLDQVSTVAPTIAQAIVQELRDQRGNLKLIASENYSSLATQLAHANLLTDKYAEGYPGHRFYAGCDNVDAIEAEAARLACELFGADHAYVQPHSGADANLVAFLAILSARVQAPVLEAMGLDNPAAASREQWASVRAAFGGQRLLALDYYSGGHLTHGYRHNISSQLFDVYSYAVEPASGLIDLDQLRARAHEVRPLILLAGYSAYPRRLNFAKMREIADEVGAVFMVDMAHFAGLVAGKVFTGDFDPVPHAHIVTTTTHKTLRGPRGGMVLCASELAEWVNKGCPAVLGGPLPHAMRGQGGGAARGQRPGVPRLRAADRRERPGAGGSLHRPVAARADRRHRQPPAADRCGRIVWPHRAPGRGGAARVRHHAQPQLAALRHKRPLVHQRAARGDAGRHHAWHGLRGDAGDRRRDQARADRHASGNAGRGAAAGRAKPRKVYDRRSRRSARQRGGCGRCSSGSRCIPSSTRSSDEERTKNREPRTGS